MTNTEFPTWSEIRAAEHAAGDRCARVALVLLCLVPVFTLCTWAAVTFVDGSIVNLLGGLSVGFGLFSFLGAVGATILARLFRSV